MSAFEMLQQGILQSGGGAPPSSGITYVGNVTDEDASGANLSPGNVSGYAADDFGLCFVYGDDNGGTETAFALITASGWTELFQDQQTPGRSRRTAVYYKKLTGSETAPEFTNQEAQAFSVSYHVFRGVDTSTPFDVTFSDATHLIAAQNNTLAACPAITTATDNAAVVLFQGLTHDDVQAAGAPSGYTMGSGLVGGTMDDRGQCVAYNLDAGTAGVNTPGAWTHTSANTGTADYTTITLALKAA